MNVFEAYISCRALRVVLKKGRRLVTFVIADGDVHVLVFSCFKWQVIS